MDQINRRKFLKSGTAGAAGLMVAGSVNATGRNLSKGSEILDVSRLTVVSKEFKFK